MGNLNGFKFSILSASIKASSKDIFPLTKFRDSAFIWDILSKSVQRYLMAFMKVFTSLLSPSEPMDAKIPVGVAKTSTCLMLQAPQIRVIISSTLYISPPFFIIISPAFTARRNPFCCMFVIIIKV